MKTTPHLMAAIGQQMKHLAENQRVISENIANSETPGFKARTVAAPNFANLVDAVGSAHGTPRVDRPKVNLSAGMAGLGARAPQAGGMIEWDRHTAETKPDGNNVTLEEQLLKMGSVQSDFAAMTNLYRKQIGLLKAALGRS